MKQVKEKYVSFEVAKLAKEKGFDRLTNNFFVTNGNRHRPRQKRTPEDHNKNENVSRPTQSLLRDWIEENSDMVLNVVPFNFCVPESFECDDTWSCSIHVKKRDNYHQWVYDNADFQTRHEAMDDLLLNALNRMG